MNWYDDAPKIEFYTRSEHIARVPHICARCKQAINVGNRYVRTASKEDGTFDFVKVHIQPMCPDLEARYAKETITLPA